jgi:hypothetical protein
MCRYFALLLLALLSGCQSALPTQNHASGSSAVQAAPQFGEEVKAVLLREIKINAPIHPTEEGVIVEVRVISLSDPALSAVVRYPGSGSVLRLKSDNTQKLSPSIQIPNQRLVEVRVNVIAVPNQLTTEGVNISAFVLGKLAEAATDAAMRRQPLLKLIPDYLLSVLSDQTKNQLLKGRVIGSARTDAHQLAALSKMGIQEMKSQDNEAFVITLEPLRKKSAAFFKRSE